MGPDDTTSVPPVRPLLQGILGTPVVLDGGVFPLNQANGKGGVQHTGRRVSTWSQERWQQRHYGIDFWDQKAEQTDGKGL